MISIRSRKIWTIIAIIELPVMAVCLWLVQEDHDEPVAVRESVRGGTPGPQVVQQAPQQQVVAEKTPEADTGAGADAAAQAMSYQECLAALAGEKDRKARVRLLRALVAAHGRERPDEAYRYLMDHRPQSEARGALLSLGIANVTHDYEIFNHVLQDTAPGEARTSLIRAAVSSLPPAKILELIGELKNSPYLMSDEFRITSALSGALDKPEMTEAVLKEMLAKTESRRIGYAIANQMIRRKMEVFKKNATYEISDYHTLSSEVPANFREFYVNKYYENVRKHAVYKHDYAYFVAKRLPEDILGSFVMEIGRVRGRKGAVQALADGGDIQGNMRPFYLKAVAADWLRKDSIGASREIGAMPPGTDRDILAAELVGFSRGNGDDESALKWASEISDEVVRERVMRELEGAKGGGAE